MCPKWGAKKLEKKKEKKKYSIALKENQERGRLTIGHS